MIENLGSLFETNAPAIGHGVNTRGLMGSGIAVLFKNKFPKMHEAYVRLCSENLFNPGETLVYVPHEGPVVYNMASQEFPGADARLELLASSADMAAEHADSLGFERIAIPRIGCGIGGLKWEDVRPVLEGIEKLHDLEFEVWVM